MGRNKKPFWKSLKAGDTVRYKGCSEYFGVVYVDPKNPSIIVTRNEHGKAELVRQDEIDRLTGGCQFDIGEVLVCKQKDNNKWFLGRMNGFDAETLKMTVIEMNGEEKILNMQDYKFTVLC